MHSNIISQVQGINTWKHLDVTLEGLPVYIYLLTDTEALIII